MACGAASTIQVNGLRLQVYRWGRPELRPALLLHSLAAHSHWWDWVAPLLAQHFQVVALDLRGHGGSDWVEPAAYRAVDYAGDIVAVLDALGWRSPLVIGHSLGGYIGVNLASLHPDRVGSLVIVDTMTQWNDRELASALEQAERPGPEFASPAEAGARLKLSPRETTAPAYDFALARPACSRVGPASASTSNGACRALPPDPWTILPFVPPHARGPRGGQPDHGQGGVAARGHERAARAVRRGEGRLSPPHPRRSCPVRLHRHRLVGGDPLTLLARRPAVRGL